MKWFLIILLFTLPCYAERREFLATSWDAHVGTENVVGLFEYEIKPQTMDLNPNDGFMDAGSYTNPYTVTDNYGNEQGTIRPQTMDLYPNDGFMDAGTYSNPYIYETNEY